MRIAYLDAFSGISGDMTLGALIDLGANIKSIERELGKLKLKGYALSAQRCRRNGLAGIRFKVTLEGDPPTRHLKDILPLIDNSDLKPSVKKSAARIFTHLAEAEAKVHGTDIENIHFHEVGAVDAIVDIVGSCVAFDLLGVERVYCSNLRVGRGTAKTGHGLIPTPGPATLELLQGMTTYSDGTDGELVTPTGAALASTLAGQSSPQPGMTVTGVGYGFGSREYPGLPNALRILLGEMAGACEYEHGVWQLETNLDDMSAEIYGYLMERLFEQGAQDVFFTPIQMKKNRPAVKVTVLCNDLYKDKIIEILFKETSTFGIRISRLERQVLERRMETRETSHGPVRFKIGSWQGQEIKRAPEYEDCRKIALKRKQAIQNIFNEIINENK
ncbi:MAG: nickel pincer cofactor biosynthesis protein LarC [bacterium]